MLARRSSLGKRMQEEEQCAATNLSDTAATSQDGSSLEFVAAITGRQCYIQDASGRGLWSPPIYLVSPCIEVPSENVFI